MILYVCSTVYFPNTESGISMHLYTKKRKRKNAKKMKKFKCCYTLCIMEARDGKTLLEQSQEQDIIVDVTYADINTSLCLIKPAETDPLLFLSSL